MSNWLEQIIPRPVLSLVTTYFEEEERWMLHESDDTLGPFVTNLPPDIQKIFTDGCIRKGLFSVMLWGISTNRISRRSWENLPAKILPTVASMELAGSPEISHLVRLVDHSALESWPSWKSDELCGRIYNGTYRLLCEWREPKNVESCIKTLVAQEKTGVLDCLAYALHPYSSSPRHEFTQTVGEAVAAQNSPRMMQWFINARWWRRITNIGKLIIATGNLEMLKLHYRTEKLPAETYRQLMGFAATSTNKEIANWLRGRFGSEGETDRSARPMHVPECDTTKSSDAKEQPNAPQNQIKNLYQQILIRELDEKSRIRSPMIDFEIAKEVIGQDDPEIWERYARDWQRPWVNTWKIAIDQGNLEFLKVYGPICGPPDTLNTLLTTAVRANRQEIADWLNSQPRVQKSWGITIAPSGR